MSYDEQSQMWGRGRCRARPNAPLLQTFAGVRKYLQLGAEAGKLVLGTPWYGYRYPCRGTAQSQCLPFLTYCFYSRVYWRSVLHRQRPLPRLQLHGRRGPGVRLPRRAHDAG